MAIITIKDLTFGYEGSFENVFENISFQIDTEWKLGLTGRNGRGKTTLLNLLLGKYEYRGKINAETSFEYFPYEVRDGEKTAAEVLGEIIPVCPGWRLLRELNLLGIPEDALSRSFNTLSNGERTKALLAALFLKENSFLLIDEPTNHLDMDARKAVSEYLGRKKGFILVSHDRTFLDNCVDHIMAINKTDIEIQKGNFSSWQKNREDRDSFELSENERLKKDIKRLESAAKRTSEWSDRVESTKYGKDVPDRGYIGHKAAKMMKRSKAIDERRQASAEQKSKLLKNIETSEPLKIHPIAYHSETFVTLRELSVSYGARTIFDNLTFSVKAGDRVAVYGGNGSGKTSLLRLVCGEDIPFRGSLVRGSGLKISYAAQDASGLRGSLDRFAAEKGIDAELLRSILFKLGFLRTQFEKDIGDYSAGQKKKVLLAGSLCVRAHLYVWDEPLNYIDVISRIQIEELIKEHRPTMLVVEHDKTFCENIATKIVRL